MAHLAGHSRQYAEGVRMARERVPQLEQALAKLTQPPKADHRKSKTENTTNNQLHLFATPSPNDYIELLAYADFLGIMDVSQAKTRFFKRDSTKADKLTLHKHKEEEFWLWVASWALFVQKPSDSIQELA